MIINNEGGLSIPSTEEPATTPTEKRGVYQCRIISGTATLVNTEDGAMELPVMAANTAFAAKLDRPIPPFTLRHTPYSTSKLSRPNPLQLTTRPMSTKNAPQPKK